MGKVKVISLREILPNLFNDLENLYSIRLLKKGRKNLDLPIHSWLKTKTIGDEVKT